MKRPTPFFAASCAALAYAALPAAASAEEATGQDRAGSLAAPGAAGEAPAGIFDTQAVSETTLQTVAGRKDTNQIAQAELAAGVSDNSVGDNAVTGNAQIDGNAFQNMSGLSILNVNTGNNVAINAAMNVNISISPAP